MNPSHRIPKSERWLRLAATPSQSSLPCQPPLDDESLIDAVVRRDVRRAGELHDRLISVIESTLFRLLGRRERDHDDLVQATFEQVVTTLVRGRFSRGCTLTTWASAVAANVALNALRSRRRMSRVFDPMAVVEVANKPTFGEAERDIEAREQLRAVQSHLAAIDPDKAMAVTLHDVLGHELTEIAVMQGISVAAAQSRLVRGRRELLKRVRLVGQDGPPKEGPNRAW